jgi:hypothetical protein
MKHTSREGCLAGQRSGGLGRDMQVVVISGVQSHLRAELTEPTEQEVDAPLQGGRSCPQDPETGTIYSFSLLISFHINLFVTLGSILQKKNTGVEPHYLDVWLHVNDNDDASVEKLVSKNIKCYAIFVIYPYVLTQYFVGTIYTRVVENPRG